MFKLKAFQIIAITLLFNTFTFGQDYNAPLKLDKKL